VQPAAQAVAFRRMESTPGSAPRPRLQVVRPAPVVDREVLGRELFACIAETPGGLAPSRMLPALSERLGVGIWDAGKQQMGVQVV